MRLLTTLIVTAVAVQVLAQDKFKHEQKIAALVEPYLTNQSKVNAIPESGSSPKATRLQAGRVVPSPRLPD